MHARQTRNATNSAKEKSAAQTASAGKPGKSVSPASEFFELLKQNTPISAEQRTRLAALISKNPSLTTLKDGAGKSARSGLFHALVGANPTAAGILSMFGNQDAKVNAETLKAAFDEILIVEYEHVKAMKIWLDSLSVENVRALKKALADQYPPGDMQKKIARPFIEILQEWHVIGPDRTNETTAATSGDLIDEAKEEGEFQVRVIRRKITNATVNNSSALQNQGSLDYDKVTAVKDNEITKYRLMSKAGTH